MTEVASTRSSSVEDRTTSKQLDSRTPARASDSKFLS